MRAARAIVMAAAVAALAMLIASGPGTHSGVWPWQTGLSLLRWAAWTGMAAGALALVLLLLSAIPRWRVRWWIPAAALVISVIAFAPPLLMLQQAKSAP